MTKNKTVLDRFFDHSTWVLKKIVTFAIVLTLIFLVLYNSADPIWTSAYLGQESTSVTFDLNQSGQTQFLIVPTNSEQGSDDMYTSLTINLLVNNDGNWSFLQTLKPERVVHILSLDRGTYKLEFENNGDLPTNIEILIAQAEPTLLILFIGAIAAFGLFIGFIQLIFPLYFILLVISLIRTPVTETSTVTPSTKRGSRKTGMRTSLLGIPEEDLTQNDKIGFAVAGVLAFIGLVSDFFPLMLFGALIFIGTYSNAQNRFKLRKRFINYANHPPYPHKYSLKEASFVLGEEVEKLEKLVLRLILDLGYPIEYDKASETVTILEDLTKEVVIRMDVQPSVTPPSAIQEEPAAGAMNEQDTAEETMNVQSSYCVKCGVTLPEGAKFCFNCGSKNA